MDNDTSTQTLSRLIARELRRGPIATLAATVALAFIKWPYRSTLTLYILPLSLAVLQLHGAAFVPKWSREYSSNKKLGVIISEYVTSLHFLLFAGYLTLSGKDSQSLPYFFWSVLACVCSLASLAAATYLKFKYFSK